jgi:hypothetical protein
MINRQKGIVIGVGAALGVACLGIGVWFFMALSESRDAAAQRDSAYDQLKALYQAKVFPKPENIQRIKDDQVALEAWATEVSNLLAIASVKVDDLTPVRFKQELQKTVRELAGAKSPAGKSYVAEDFKFGFDRYLGDSDSLPQAADVPQLARQLNLIQTLVRELYAANIVRLTSVEREVFEVDASEKTTSRPARPKRPSAAVPKPGQSLAAEAAAVSDTLNPALSPLLAREKLTFGFQAKPAALIGALNRLAAMENTFAVVSGVELVKSADSVMRAEERKKAAAKAAEDTKTSSAAADDVSDATRDRIVTDTEREPPLNVTLSVDAYFFKGV